MHMGQIAVNVRIILNNNACGLLKSWIMGWDGSPGVRENTRALPRHPLLWLFTQWVEPDPKLTAIYRLTTIRCVVHIQMKRGTSLN